MPSRREFVRTGLSALMLGMFGRRALGAPPVGVAPAGPGDPDFAGGPLDASRPFMSVPTFPQSVVIDGMPFAPGFFGDPFPQAQIPFHVAENQFPGNRPPKPTEKVDLVIAGGGLSGLAAAYFLRDRGPVVFELHPRFGGVSQGEIWSGTRYSQGGAYFIQPDKGSFLESLYHELGLDQVYALSPGGDDPAELHGAILRDFWSGDGVPPEQQAAFAKYAAAVKYFAEESYPDIPFDDPGRENRWIIDLDRKTFKQDVEERLGGEAPPLLAAGIQSYFYSSFNAGWEEVSAASGWNFIAAEEYGRWVCPGGNAWVVDQLWKRLVRAYSHDGRLDRLRPGTRVVDVRMAPHDRVHVTYRDAAGRLGALLADRVVMACSKHVCKYVVQDMQTLHPPLMNAMQSVITNPYIVANVLLTEAVEAKFYDAFLLGGGVYPVNQAEAADFWKVTDMISAGFSDPFRPGRSVLTLYWPLPWSDAVFQIIGAHAHEMIARKIAPQIRSMLSLLDVKDDAVRQVRLTRWGHAMPIAYPGFIASGAPQVLREGYADRILFANQDTWALPAFETSLLEAKFVADRIAALR